MDITLLAKTFGDFLVGWPLLTVFLGTSVILTVALNFVQLRQFFAAWRLVLKPTAAETEHKGGSEISAFQAFIASLGSNTGNGSIAGVAVAIFAGGPGAAFWILVAGFLGMAIRFAEVYISTCFTGVHSFRGALGGPMVYLNRVPGRTFLPYVFAVMFLIYALIGGNAMQANSIAAALDRTLGVNVYITAVIFLVFLLYASLGGVKRILSISDRITPIKVGIFVVCALVVLIGNYQALLGALALIVKSAFTCQAAVGGVVGWTVQLAMQHGIVTASLMGEAGLGSAALAFGATGSKRPVQDSFLSMVPVFISTYIVGFLVAMCVVASGVWNNGETGIALTISSFETVFSCYGGWIVSFLSLSFGLGCMAAVLFISMRSWLFLTNNRFAGVYYALFCGMAFFGAVAKVPLIWALINIIIALMLFVNLYAILWLLPTTVKGLRAFQNKAE